MREILFRGKRISNSKWVEGFMYSQHFPLEFRDDFYIRCYDTDYLVIPETVGQYTGLTDNNGTKIFEGDILDVSSDVAYGGVAVHRLGYFVVEFHNGCFMKSALDDPQLSFFDNAKRKGLYHFISTDIHKIVGNIHDNPELLQKI